MTTISLGQTDHGALKVDIGQLVFSRGLVTASSGGGKSWLLRLLAERSIGKVPIIILDPEGEFSTLREKFDLLLVGDEGEIALDLRSAKLLGRKLVELGVSAIIDLSTFDSWDDRREWVALFIDGLMNVPRSMWHPLIVLVDEAHMLAPRAAGATRKGDPVVRSRHAITSLMSAGRKRGFCGILATQRISKLDADAKAEGNNVWIGRTTLDIDQQRAADVLGITNKVERVALRDLRPGEWFCFGPAILGSGVHRFRSDQVTTTHPKGGQRRTLEVPRASDAVKAIAAALADLPQQAQREADELAALQRENTRLKQQLAARPAPTPAPARPEVIERRVEVPVPVFKDGEIGRLEAAVGQLGNIGAQFEATVGQLGNIGAQLADAGGSLKAAASGISDSVRAARASSAATVRPTQPARPAPTAAPARPAPAPARSAQDTGMAAGTKLAKAERAILTVLAQRGSRTKRQVAVQTGYAHKGGGFNNAISSLSTSGLVARDGERLTITDAGLQTLGAWEPLPTGAALLAHWQRQLPKAERRVLDVLAGVYPQTLSKEAVAEAAGYQANGGGFNNAISRLRTLELITGKSELCASDDLFGD